MNNFGKLVQLESLEESEQQAVRGAVETRPKAYCPYSKFHVGAAVVAGSGKIYKGCNVENAAYPVSLCAERTAIVKAVSEGETSITCVAVVADKEGHCAPCGGCRQVIYEFGHKTNCKVLLVNGDLSSNNECLQTSIRELLPIGFGPADLESTATTS